jgi:hypothetical protein
MNKKIVKMLLCIVLTASFTDSFAVTACSGKITKVFVGDSGNLWISTDRSPDGVLFPNDPNFKIVYAAALLALNSDKPVTIRFTADGVACSPTSYRTDVNGLYVYRQ